MSPFTRRDAIKAGAGIVLGATLTSKAGDVNAAGHSARSNTTAIFAWREVRKAADERGMRWVEQASLQWISLGVQVEQAVRADLPAMVGPLREQLVEAEVMYRDRKDVLDRWEYHAWNLPDLAPLPAEPWG